MKNLKGKEVQDAPNGELNNQEKEYLQQGIILHLDLDRLFKLMSHRIIDQRSYIQEVQRAVNFYENHVQKINDK